MCTAFRTTVIKENSFGKRPNVKAMVQGRILQRCFLRETVRLRFKCHFIHSVGNMKIGVGNQTVLSNVRCHLVWKPECAQNRVVAERGHLTNSFLPWQREKLEANNRPANTPTTVIGWASSLGKQTYVCKITVDEKLKAWVAVKIEERRNQADKFYSKLEMEFQDAGQ